MYRVVYADNPEMENPLIIHDVGRMNALSDGDLELNLEGLGISTFSFSLNPKNELYRKAKPLKSYVDVYDVRDETRLTKVFSGRILRIENKMSSSGDFKESIVCEDKKAFLHDSIQKYMKPEIISVRDYLYRLLTVHNSQVEPFKKIYLGDVTVGPQSTYRNIGYQTTADTIRDKLLNQLGGYLVLRESYGSLYLDYLSDYGKVSQTPLQITRNLRSANRNIDITNLATRVIPLGADVEKGEGEEEIKIPGVDSSRPKITIEEINGGKVYLEASDLVQEFGILTKTIDFSDVKDPYTLREKGQEYLKNQQLLLVNWSVEVVELGLLDPKYEIIQLGNSYPVLNPILYGAETLRVIQKKIDILQPQRITLTIGSRKKTLTQYQQDNKTVVSSLQSMYSNLQQNNNNLTDLIKEAEVLKEKADLIAEQQERLKELEKIISDLTSEVDKLKNSEQPSYLTGKIIDVSEFQGAIDWEKVKAEDEVALAIIRVQYGAGREDERYKINISECERLGIRYAVYAYCTFGDARSEATEFYDRTQSAGGRPVFYCSDYEEDVENAREWANTFVATLKARGVPNNQQVAYIANHLYGKLNIDVSQFGSIWLPAFRETPPDHACDLWQYTNNGAVQGIDAQVDLSKEPSDKFKNQYLKK